MTFQTFDIINTNLLLEGIIMIFLIIIMLYCYKNTKGFWLVMLIFLFSLIIGSIAISSESPLPFTPYIQIFFILFQLFIFLLKILNLD